MGLVIAKILKAIVAKIIVLLSASFANLFVVFKSFTFKALGLCVAFHELVADRLYFLVSNIAKHLVIRFVRDDPEVKQATREMAQRLEQALWLDYTIARLVFVTCVISLVIFVVTPLIYKVLSRRRLRIFISFNRAREYIAADLQGRLEAAGARVLRISFQEGIPHQAVVRQVTEAIQSSDGVVCLPGDTQSYVDHEVLAATVAGKPVTFLVSTTGTLPNTADKRYPTFCLERTQREQFKPLIDFISYVGADFKSTVKLSMRALCHPLMHVSSKAALFLMGICLVSLWLYCFYNVRVSGHNLAKEIASFAEVERAVVIAYSTVLIAVVSIAFCSFSYEFLFLLSFVRQFQARRKARLKTIAAQFNRGDWIGAIPNLAPGQELYECLFDTSPSAHHETEGTVPIALKNDYEPTLKSGIELPLWVGRESAR